MMTVQDLVRKISRLIEMEFGCNVVFEVVDGATEPVKTEPFDKDSHYMEIARRNSEARRVYNGSDLILPIKYRDAFLGAVTLVGGFNVRTVHVEKLEEILSDAFIKAYNGEALNESVQQLESYIESLTVPENVIFLTDIKQRRRQKLRELGLDHEAISGRPVFVHSEKQEDLQKIAVDIHREMGSNGFVPWFALDQKSLNSVESLKELGPITIFVSELTDLDSDQQGLVEDLINNHPKENVPQFIFGSQRSLTDLMTTNCVSEGLARLLQ